MEFLNEWYYKLEAYFKAHPDRAFLAVGVIFLILSVVNFLGKTDPSSYRQKRVAERMGTKMYGKLVGLGFLIGSLGCFYLAYINM